MGRFRIRRVLAAAGVVVLASVWRLGAQTPTLRLADTLIPSAQPITLSLPTNDIFAFNTVRMLLARLKVPYGVETPGLPDVPLADFAHPAAGTLTLSGMRLGDALDAIVRVAPHFRWSEIDERIVVRGGPIANGLLDKKVSHLSLESAAPAAALGALITAIDPTRRGEGMTPASAPVPAAALAALPDSAKARNVSVKLDDVTVLSALNAIARAGNLFWIVEYDGPVADLSSASVSFHAGDLSVTAHSPVWIRSNTAPEQIRIGVLGNIEGMLTAYARAAHVRVGLELVPPPDFLGPPPGPAAPLDLTHVPPFEAIKRIVAYDSRYEVSQSKDAFHVTPTMAVPGRLMFMDKAVSGFTASHEAIGAVLGRIIWLLGYQPAGTASVSAGPSMPMNAPGAAQRTQDIRTMPVTFTVGDRSTVRDVLDALCRAQGTLSWRLRPPSSTGTMVELRLTSTEGWTIAQSFAIPAQPVRPAGMPGVPVPRAMDRDIGAIQVAIGSTGALNPFDQLLRQGVRTPAGLEQLPAVRRMTVDPRVVEKNAPALTLGPGKLSDALYVLLERVPDYELTIEDGVLNIAPTSLLHSPTHFLNASLEHFEVHDVTIDQGVRALRHQLNPLYPEGVPGSGGSGGSAGGLVSAARMQAAQALFGRRISVSMDHASPREILNRLVSTHGEMMWSVRYDSLDPSVAAEPTESNCVILLSTFYDIGITRQFDPVRPPRAPGSLPAMAPPARGPSTPRVTVVLPTTAQDLILAVREFARATRATIDTEVIQPTLTPQQVHDASIRRMSAPQYDLGGLAIPDALDKILAGMPDYEWTKAGDVYRVQPKSFRDNSGVALSKPVGNIDQAAANLHEALFIVQALLDPGARRPPGTPIMNTPDRVRAIVDQPFAIKLTHATVRDVLDEIVRQVGGMSWSVEYREPSGASGSMQIHAQGFDGWEMSVPATIR